MYMGKFKLNFKKTCAYCGNEFMAKIDRAMYCSPLCKGRALSKPRKVGEDGSYTKVCARCGTSFVTSSKNKRLCEDCALASQRESVRTWHKNNPEWQKRWDKSHPESIRASQQKWNENNPDKVKEINARHAAKRKLKRVEDKRNKSIERQKFLADNAVRYNAALWLDKYEYMDIGVERLTANLCRCARCGKEFYASRTESAVKRFLDRRKLAGKSPCPYCGDMPAGLMTSKYEDELYKLYPNFTERHYRPVWLDGQEIDLYDPVAKVGVEFHGLFHHSDRVQQRAGYHSNKADKADFFGIQLLQIYESEWVQKREIVLDRIDSVLHRSMRKEMARKLRVRILTTEKDHADANSFLERNHIQGSAPFQWGVALEDGEGIAAVCTFRYGTGYASGGQLSTTAKYWELNRYATRLHLSVQGGLGRCISYFWRHNPEVSEVYSFADRRWTCSRRSAYSSTGFEEVARLRANYMYTDLDPSHPLMSKQFMRKSRIKQRNPEVYSEDKTEIQMAHELGWYRIFDAGKIKYRISR